MLVKEFDYRHLEKETHIEISGKMRICINVKSIRS